MLTGVAILGDRNVLKKEAEMIPQYGDLRMKFRANGL
jgi:hypothetical protein